MMIVILGPDGSGKSSVIEGMQASLIHEFDHIETHHLKFKRPGQNAKADASVTEPHQQVPYNGMVSFIKLLYFVLIYNIGYWRNRSHVNSSQSLLIFDRYYHDLLVDPKRYRYGGPLLLAGLLGHLIPVPELFILLDAPTEILQSRKQEVSAEETGRQRQAYLAWVNRQRSGRIVNCDQPLNQVVEEVNRLILGQRETGKHQ